MYLNLQENASPKYHAIGMAWSLISHMAEARGLTALGDKHLDQLQTLLKATPIQDDSRYLYKTLYALWSPRGDPRRAVIDTFCEWFDKKQVEFSRESWEWLAEVLAKTPLDKVGLSDTLQVYFIRTKQTQEMIRPVLAGGMGKTSKTAEIKDTTY